MSRTLQEIRDARVVLRAELDKLDSAQATVENITRAEEIETEFEMLEREEAVLEKRAARETANDAGVPPPVVGGDGEGEGQISDMRNLEAEKPYATFGMQLRDIHRATTGQRITAPQLQFIQEQRDNEERAVLGLSEGVPSDGGFLLQSDFSNELFRSLHDSGELLGRTRRTPIGPGANRLTWNSVDETSRADGSRSGGVSSAWTNEAAALAATSPKFRQSVMALEKLTGLFYATEEQLQDTVQLEAIVNEAFDDEFGFKVQDAIFTGDGAGKPQGIMDSVALVTVDKETNQVADTLTVQNIYKMYARMWARSLSNSAWFINQDVWPQIFTLNQPVGTGGVPLFIMAGGIANAPNGAILGRPIIPIEQCATIGTTGDIVLADFSQYRVIEKSGLQTASSIHVQFLTAQTAFRFILRINGQSMWNSPLTPAKSALTLSPFVALQSRD